MPNILKEKLITPEAIDALRGLYQNSTLGKQNFQPGSSTIGSAINNPGEAVQRAIKWIEENMHTAAGMPQQNQDEGSMYAYGPSGEQQAQAGINLAGMAELGSMPGAPMSSGGTLGTAINPWEQAAMQTRGAQTTVPRAYMPVGQGPQGDMMGTLSRSEQNALTQRLGMQSPMRGYVRK